MKKIKLFFATAAITTITAGIYAAKTTYTADPLYYLSGATNGVYERLGVVTAGVFTTTGINQAKLISSNASVAYPLYTFSIGIYTQVYTTF